MYNFIDVNQTSGAVSLPSEAMQINGEYIENLITGYRTLTVEGREALSPELSTYETGIRDGATLKNKRYPPRTIRVTYQILANSNTAFRNAYNELARILDVKDAQLIFADEQDKFFTGTPSYIGEVTPGRNSVVGEFEILCTDPFKYSIYEREVTPVLDSKSILLEYGGTYKAFPKLVAEFYKESDTSAPLTGAGDCGYVAFFNENEKTIQLGDPEETDSEELDIPSKKIISSVFDADNANFLGTGSNKWVENSGITSSSAVQQVGSVYMGPSEWITKPAKPSGATVLNTWSRAEAPNVHYVIGMTGIRTSSVTVNLTVSISANLEHSSSYFRQGYQLEGKIKIGNKTKTITLKKNTEIWEGTALHSKSFNIDVIVGASDEYITGITFQAYRVDFLGDTGELPETACSNFPIKPYDTKEPSAYYLTPKDYGTGTDWHGPSITRTIPADQYGEVGAKNFELTFKPKISLSNGSGAFQCMIATGSGSSREILAGISIYDGGAGKTYLRYYFNGAVKDTIPLNKSKASQYFTGEISQRISKTGEEVMFEVAGYKRIYSYKKLADTMANEITFTFLEGQKGVRFRDLGLTQVSFTKIYRDVFRDIPNKFGANDVIEADCNTGEIFLNGALAPGFGALGNDWEGFYLKPGINEIGFSYSDWVAPEYAPEFKLKYREVFL